MSQGCVNGDCTSHNEPQPLEFQLIVSDPVEPPIILCVMMNAPRQLGTPEETFDALCKQFNLDDKVKECILKQGCKTLSDFRFLVQDENEVKTVFIDPLRDLEGPRLQTARLRHAWTACKALIDSQQVQSAQPVSIEDEDALLPSDELQDLKAIWFRRYHLKPDPSVMPNDRLISRLVRSLRKQAFEVMDLWTVRSLAHQRTHGQKRRKVGEGLWLTEEDTSEEVEKHSWTAYLKKMDIYLCALSIAGCRVRADAPAVPETPASESTDYVEIPYDLLLRYKARAEELALRVQENRRLTLVAHLDGHERAEWSARLGAQSEGLGKLIQTITQERNALWISGAASVGPAGASGGGASSAGSPPAQSEGVSFSLRDGTVLCPDFQRGKCSVSTRECPKGAHRCGKTLTTGRVCGSYGHNPKA